MFLPKELNSHATSSYEIQSPDIFGAHMSMKEKPWKKSEEESQQISCLAQATTSADKSAREMKPLRIIANIFKTELL